MQQDEELPVSVENLPASLPRTCIIPDFTKLFNGTQSPQHRPRAGSRRSENNVSENSQILYMADSKKSRSRQDRQSLSSMGNCVNRRYDGSSDEKDDAQEDDTLSWDVIDQEIYEWQYACQTGRPYWWSPESKYTRMKRHQPRSINEPSPKLWTGELDGRSKPACAEKRRAVSDNYFCDPKTVHDMAHLIAVQLLGACFTLPPDHILGIPNPAHAIDKTSARLPDPRMISSLRMHTQFRYSPCFGHQARNTSPVQAWPRSFAKSHPGFSSPTAGGRSSTSAARRTERRRTVNFIDGSGSCASLDSDGDRLAQSYSSSDELDSDSKEVHRGRGKTHGGHISTVVNSSRQRAERLRKKTNRQKSKEVDFLPNQGAHNTNYRLEPVIRSEPHHVFIQPVRELVVKRWSNFKRRLSGSLHSALPGRGSEDGDSASETGSPAISSDGKARRRRAQERGDIHSSDIESPPHFNTPASGNLTPADGLVSPNRIDLINEASFRLSNSSIAEAALAAAERRAAASPTPPPARSRREPSPSESSLHPMGYQDPAVRPVSAPARPAFPVYPRFNSFSSRRRPNGEKRKSTLSEMFTAEDDRTHEPAELAGRGVSSAPVTANVTPLENEDPELDFMASTSTFPTLGDPATSLRPRLSRPRLSRTSTSGTQIFTPTDDGIELDGLPAGPIESTWVEPGRGERTYL